MSDANELVRVVFLVRCVLFGDDNRRVRVIETLELLREGCAPVELEAGVYATPGSFGGSYMLIPRISVGR
jgi:hypothetical protein